MLKNKVSVYVPSTYRDQAAPDNVVKFYVNNTLKELSKMYGGATATAAIGSYCEELKTVFLQESISLEINNTLEFI